MQNYQITRNSSYIYYFRNIENWLHLLKSERSQNNRTSSLLPEDIDSICDQLCDKFKNIFFALHPKKRATFVIIMLNTSIRIYAADKFATITSREKFQNLVKMFEDRSHEMLKSGTYDGYSELMLDLLLRNFGKEGFLIDYLERLSSKSCANGTGTVSDRQQGNIFPLGLPSE